MKNFKTITYAISWILLIVVTFLLFMKWKHIDSIVGIHLNLSGDIDNYGSKYDLPVILVFGYVINFLSYLGFETVMIRK